MPPKSSSVAWPPRPSRTTVRKSALAVLCKCTSIPKTSPSPSSQDNSLTPPPASTSSASITAAAAISPSLEFSQNDSVLVTSPDNKRTLQTENSFHGESSPPVNSNDGARAPVSANQINVGDEAQEKNLVNSSSLNPEVVISPKNLIPAEGQDVKAQAGDETLVASGKAAVDADGVRTVLEGGKKKVVKRVKVVKKIVKRVIKKVPKGSLESVQTETVSNVGYLNDKTETLESKLNVSKAMEIEKVDRAAIVSVEKEKFEPNDTAPLGVENEGSEETKVDLGVEKIGPFVEPVSPMGVSSEDPFTDNNDGKEGEGTQCQIEDDKDSGDCVENQNVVPAEGGASDVEADNNDVEGKGTQNQIEDDKDGGDFAENQNVVTVEEGASEVEEEVKECIENNGAGLCGGVALSGEMEAVERRRRRQTEIFLGGLDKETKEEDIKKVFELVGEVTEVRLVINTKTGKNKGFAFVRFASAADAKKALAKYSKVEICGKQCGAQPVEGNDTLFLGNINKKWKNDDVIRLLKDAGIEKIDKVTVKADPNNLEQNRGFAFLELETSKDAQIAFNKLQKNDVFNKQTKIKVEWAQPLVEPHEKEMLKVKSVYAEYLPSSWNEEKVKIFFKRFGEIESLTLAKNLSSSRRKDFAFVNYTSREAALACIEAFCREQVDEDGFKVNVKVSLAKPQKKSKEIKHVTGKELSKNKPKTPQSILKVHELRNKGIPTSRSHEVTSDRPISPTNELIHLLRQQAASGRPIKAGSSDLNYHHSSAGSKRPSHELGNCPLSSDPRGFPRTRLESSHLIGNSRSFSHDLGWANSPYSQQQNSYYTFESSHGIPNYSHFQAREEPPSFGRSRLYQR